jgi:hypothetical protein
MYLFCVCVVLHLGRGLYHETEKEARAHGSVEPMKKKSLLKYVTSNVN